MLKHKCPHCGENSFSIIDKALAGNYTSEGKKCPNCGRRAVNGMPSTIFRSVSWLAVVIIMLVRYFGNVRDMQVLNIWEFVAVFAIGFILPYIFDAFFGKLVPSITQSNKK